MACIQYKPKRSLTTSGAQIYACDDYRDLCFKMTVPQFTLDQDKSEEKALSGRPCIDKTKEDCMTVQITAVNLHIKEKPVWIEFIRSVGCGEEVIVPHNLMPCIAAAGLTERAVVTGTPVIRLQTRRLFSVQFTLRFWEWL